MDSVLIKVIATAAWVVISAVFGFLLRAKGKPYGLWKPLVHGLLFLFIAAGTASLLAEVILVSPLRVWSLAAISLVGVTVLCNLVVGLIMVFGKGAHRGLPSVHLFSSTVLAAGLIAAAIFSVMKL